jgi:radical SAM superfamily enzyme YgiQ (UPF0313 family)
MLGSASTVLRLDGLHYEGRVIRPPSEADSILLEVTVGCSHNRCAFCGAYRGERFQIKDDATVFADIAYAARHFRDRSRVFLCNGDALIVPQPRLLRWLEAMRASLPWLTRVGTYANAKAIAKKTMDELRELRSLGLRMVHMGLESGDDETLRAVQKRGDSAFIIEQGRRARAAGIRVFVTVLLGLGGTSRSDIHARATGEALTRMQPDFVGALTLMLVPGTPLYDAAERGDFVLGDPAQMLRELRTMLFCTEMERGIFYANHASTYLPLRVQFPRGKPAAIALVDRALAGDVALRPEWMRGL